MMNGSTSLDQIFLQRLSSLMDTHLCEERFGVKELAREIGLSKSQLLRKLQSLKGKSTSQFIREYRLQKAMELLQQGAGTASEIAYRVGFSSPTYFSTCFHEYFGYPPGEVKYRQNGDQGAMDTAATHQRTKNGRKRIAWLFGLGLVLVAATSFMVYLDSGRNEAEPTTNPLVLSEEEKSIGVLPFVNLSGNSEYDYVGDGMTGAIIDKLTRLESFKKVVPYTTMSTFKETDKGVREIASELGVTHLLEGNLQKAGDTVKVVLRLIDGASESYDWTEEYTVAWEIDELFKMQADVTENIAQKLGVALKGQENLYATINRKPTDKTKAFTYYQRAEYEKNKYDKKSMDLAEELYNRAIQLDSTFAEPYVGLGFIWQTRAWWGFHEEKDAIDHSLRYLKRAIELDPDNPWANNYYYIMNFWYNWEFDETEKWFQEMLEEGSLYKSLHIMDYAMKTDRHSISLQLSEELLSDAPNDPKLYANHLLILWINGRLDECLKMLSEDSHIKGQDGYQYFVVIPKLYFSQGNFEEAKEFIKRIPIPQDTYTYDKITYHWLNAVIDSKLGSQSDAEEHLSELVKLSNTKDRGSPAWYTALYFCVTGDDEKTLAWLQKSYEQHEVEMTWLYAEPLLKPIKDDPRYLELLHKVGFSKVISL